MNQPKADPFQDLAQREEQEFARRCAARLTALRKNPSEELLEREMLGMLHNRDVFARAKTSIAHDKKENGPIRLANMELARDTEAGRNQSAIRLSKHERVLDGYLRLLDAEYEKQTGGQSFLAGADRRLYNELKKPIALESSVLSTTERKQVLNETLAAGETSKTSAHQRTPANVPTLTQVVSIAPVPVRVAAPTPQHLANAPTLTEAVAAPTPRQAAVAPKLTDVVEKPTPTTVAKRQAEPVIEQPKPALFGDLSAELPKDFPPRLGGASRAYWETRHAREIKSLQTAERQFGNNPAQLDTHLKATEIRLRIEADEATKDGTVRLQDPAHKAGYYNHKVARTSEEKTALARKTYDYLSVVHNARNELAERNPDLKAAQMAKTAADRAVETTAPMPLDVSDAPRERSRLKTFFATALSNGLDHVRGVYGNVKDMLHIGSKAGNDDFNPDSELAPHKKANARHLVI